MFFVLLLAVSLGAPPPDAAAATKPGVTLFVATTGNDAWSGALAEPNAAKTDGPLATLAAARDKLRAMRKAGPLPRGGAEVMLRGGSYFLAQTLELAEADSGTADAPIVYRAALGENARIIGGRPITGFVPHRGSILETNVAGQGFKGIHFGQLYFDGKRQSMARYPNFDPKNPYGGGWAYVDGTPKASLADESRRTFQYKPQDVRNWSRPTDGQVFIFPSYNWWNHIIPIAALAPEKRTITLAAETSLGIRPGDRYYVQGLIEELDAPGEWCLDPRTETLYFWPPGPLEEKGVYAPTIRTLIAIGNRASHITIRGLTLECCEGTAVTVDWASDCLIAGNTIRNAGDYNGGAVMVNAGQRNGVVGNDIYEIGRTAITLNGGDRITLTPAEHYAENNYIHHVGVLYKQGVGICLVGVGNRAAHNLIHDCPRFGIEFSGNNLVVEYNHIRHVCLETCDAGALYTGGRDWISSRGSAVRYNFIHDVLGYGQENGHWKSPHFAWGIYLDDNTGGVDLIGNIVVRAFRGLLHLHNGRDNLVENNIFVGGTLQQIECQGWTEVFGGWNEHLPTMIQGFQSVANQPAWRNMRNMDLPPDKAVLPNGMIMTGNTFQRNIFYYRNPDSKLFRLVTVPLDRNRSDYNLAFHFGKPLVVDYAQAQVGAKATSTPTPWPQDAPKDGRWPRWWHDQGQDRHSLVANPLFVDANKDDYRLNVRSPALKLGFKPTATEKIGPYADPLRASWPIVEAEGAREKPLQPRGISLPRIRLPSAAGQPPEMVDQLRLRPFDRRRGASREWRRHAVASQIGQVAP
jgi:hypothetical protein